MPDSTKKTANTLKGRFTELSKEMGSHYQKHLDWVIAITLAYRMRTGEALRPDTEFSAEDEDMAQKIMSVENAVIVQ